MNYDVHIDPVTVQDAGVYTCVDQAGIGMKASATLSVLSPSTSQPSPRTTRQLSRMATSLTTSLSHHVTTHREGALSKIFTDLHRL